MRHNAIKMERTSTTTSAAYRAMMRTWFETRTPGLPSLSLVSVWLLLLSVVDGVVVLSVVVGLFL